MRDSKLVRSGNIHIVSCGMFSNVIRNVISLVLRDTDTDSKNVIFVRRSISDGQKTCSSKGISLIGYNKYTLF